MKDPLPKIRDAAARHILDLVQPVQTPTIEKASTLVDLLTIYALAVNADGTDANPRSAEPERLFEMLRAWHAPAAQPEDPPEK